MEQFCPIMKFLKKQAMITSFEQGNSESLYNACDVDKLGGRIKDEVVRKKDLVGTVQILY